MIETALVFDKLGQTLYWHEPKGRSGGALPDDVTLWDFLWEHRNEIGGVAHTHPWDGDAYPSHTDVTTFAAIEQGLGRKLIWPVVTFTDVAYLYRVENETVYTRIAPLFGLEDLELLRNKSR